MELETNPRKLLKGAGFEEISKRGSHLKLRKGKIALILPDVAPKFYPTRARLRSLVIRIPSLDHLQAEFHALLRVTGW